MRSSLLSMLLSGLSASSTFGGLGTGLSGPDRAPTSTGIVLFGSFNWKADSIWMFQDRVEHPQLRRIPILAPRFNSGRGLQTVFSPFPTY